jgi:hypothetical protein
MSDSIYIIVGTALTALFLYAIASKTWGFARLLW